MPYSAALETTQSRPIGVNGIPDGAHTYFHDLVNGTYRPFQSTQEVLDYFPTAANKKGHQLIVVNTGGVLSAGQITGGTNDFYYFRDQQNLVKLIPEGVGGAVSKLEFIVGDGTANTPANGETSFTNSSLISKEIIHFVKELITIPMKVRTDQPYAQLNASVGTLTLSNSTFSTGEYILILYK